jgi:hypothetical protein
MISYISPQWIATKKIIIIIVKNVDKRFLCQSNPRNSLNLRKYQNQIRTIDKRQVFL